MNSIWKNHQYYLLLLLLFFFYALLGLSIVSVKPKYYVKFVQFSSVKKPSKEIFSIADNCNFHTCTCHVFITMLWHKTSRFLVSQRVYWRLIFLLARQFLFLFCRMWSVWCGMRGFSQECFHFRELTCTVKSLKCEGAALLTSCYQQSNYNLSSTSWPVLRGVNWSALVHCKVCTYTILKKCVKKSC